MKREVAQRGRLDGIASALRGVFYPTLTPRRDELLRVPAGALEEPIRALGQIGWRPLGSRRDHGSLLAAKPSDSTSRNADRPLADRAMLELAALDQLIDARRTDAEQRGEIQPSRT